MIELRLCLSPLIIWIYKLVLVRLNEHDEKKKIVKVVLAKVKSDPGVSYSIVCRGLNSLRSCFVWNFYLNAGWLPLCYAIIINFDRVLDMSAKQGHDSLLVMVYSHSIQGLVCKSMPVR